MRPGQHPIRQISDHRRLILLGDAPHSAMTKARVRLFIAAKSLMKLPADDYYSVALVSVDRVNSLWNYDGFAKLAND